MLRLMDGPVRFSSPRSHWPSFRCGKPGSIVPLLPGFFLSGICMELRASLPAVARAWANLSRAYLHSRPWTRPCCNARVVTAGRGPLLSRHIQGRHTTRCEQALQRRSTSRPRACTEIARRSVRVQGRPASPLILYRGGFAVGRLSPRRAVFLRQSPRDSARKRGVATASATDNQGLRIACPLYLCDWHMLGAVREQPAFH